MNRRDFVTAGVMAGIGSVAAKGMLQETSGNQAKFRMKYAPHFGMFKNSAGNDPIDQLKFAADQGFTAWEDNGMMRRDTELQKKIARTMEQFGQGAVRGSSNRGGRQAFRELVELAKQPFDLVFTPDGPKGPRHQVKEGVVQLARISGRRAALERCLE